MHYCMLEDWFGVVKQSKWSSLRDYLSSSVFHADMKVISEETIQLSSHCGLCRPIALGLSKLEIGI